MTQKITPFLWFDDKVEEAVHFYTSIFKNAKVGTITHYDAESAKVAGRPEGSVLTVGFTLAGQEFGALNGGPIFKFTPAVSFFVSCETEEEIDELWKKLSDGDNVLMEFQNYPFAEKYGWLNDKYGVSWQLMLNHKKQSISPALLFVEERYGKAEEAINFYTSVFPDSHIAHIQRRGNDHPETEKEGTVEYASFTLSGQEFHAMEGNQGHHFDFTPAISFLVNCETQEEVDTFWEKLSAVPQAEQCGWLMDKYGVSWQIVPTILDEMLADPDPKKAQRVMHAMLQMKKIVIEDLKKAYEQE